MLKNEQKNDILNDINEKSFDDHLISKQISQLYLQWLSLPSTELFVKNLIEKIKYDDYNPVKKIKNNKRRNLKLSIPDEEDIDIEALIFSPKNKKNINSLITNKKSLSSPNKSLELVNTKQSPPRSPKTPTTPPSNTSSPKRSPNSISKASNTTTQSPYRFHSTNSDHISNFQSSPKQHLTTTTTTKIEQSSEISILMKPILSPELIDDNKKRTYQIYRHILSQRDNKYSNITDEQIDNNEGLYMKEFYPITIEICNMTIYCNSILFSRIYQNYHTDDEINKIANYNNSNDNDDEAIQQYDIKVNINEFLDYWHTYLAQYDDNTRFFKLLCNSNHNNPCINYLVRQDFVPILSEILRQHPGLRFLEKAPLFQDKYAITVIARIFYQVNISGSERLTLSELKNSNFLITLYTLSIEDDINRVYDYFSYEYFYVIYCRFWELDQDHNSLINIDDLLRYDDYSLTNIIVERIINGHGRLLRSNKLNYMNYEDFIVFFISEVDKTSIQSITYWFNIIDIDKKGYITIYDIQDILMEQIHRLQSISQATINSNDIICQLYDILQLSYDIKHITLSHLISCKYAKLFFNLLFNWNQYLITEQRDPIRIQQIQNTPQLSDWDRYTLAQYIMLAESEENEQQQQQQQQQQNNHHQNDHIMEPLFEQQQYEEQEHNINEEYNEIINQNTLDR